MQMFYFYLSILVLVLLPSPSHSETVVVDGSTPASWKHSNPIVNIGDSIIFRQKYEYSLYIFRSRLAFNLCNFSEATRLTLNPNTSSTYTWRPSRLGNFYFAFSNGGSNKPCEKGQKLAIKVIPETTVAVQAPLSPPYPWPFQPRDNNTGPGGSPSPAAATTTTVPLMADGKGGVVPFINSNPAVPLPTAQVDSANDETLVPTLGIKNHAKLTLVGLLGVLIPPCGSVLLMF